MPDASITIVTSIDKATLAAHTFVGTFSEETFQGTRVDGPGSLTLTFGPNTEGADGTNPVVQLTRQSSVGLPNFIGVSDPLGNECNGHRCGLETLLPARYFGGCSGNTTAGTLCCPVAAVVDRFPVFRGAATAPPGAPSVGGLGGGGAARPPMSEIG